MNLKEVSKNTIIKLQNSSIEVKEAFIETEMLLNFVFGITKKDIILHPERELSENKLETFNSLIDRRIKEKIPVQYLTNKAYFMGEEFYVDENVLIPRPETEILVEEVIHLCINLTRVIARNEVTKQSKNKELWIASSRPADAPRNDNIIKIVDIGTGSGCIACMIAKHVESARIFASDISEKALKVAEFNAEKLGIKNNIEKLSKYNFKKEWVKGRSPFSISTPSLEGGGRGWVKRNALIKNPHKITFINSDIFESIDTKEKFDVIVSNPPYISILEKQNLQPEVVLHEPHRALFTEDEKGISFYEKLAFQAKNRLNKNGYLAVEIGIYQAADVVKIFENAGFKEIKVIKDFNNIERIVIGKLRNHLIKTLIKNWIDPESSSG